MPPLKGAAVGAGYFSQFHYEAWRRIPEASITALCDRDAARAAECQAQFGVAKVYGDFAAMLDAEQPDFVDIITPPESHLELVRLAAERGIAIICQKALAPDLASAEQIVAVAEEHNVPFMVHDNFRYQPWHRQIKQILDAGAVGRRLHSLSFRTRQGDGWGEDAYLDRQPYFRKMRQLLVYETGIHFIDVFRYLGGEIAAVYAQLRKLNPVIAGEDAAMLLFEFENGALGCWDANRYNEPDYPNPRYTFGEFLIECDGGSIRCDGNGRLTVQPLGEAAHEVPYEHRDKGFAGDCVHAAQRHFIACLSTGKPFETGGREYLKSLRVQEAVYRSAQSQARIPILK